MMFPSNQRNKWDDKENLYFVSIQKQFCNKRFVFIVIINSNFENLISATLSNNYLEITINLHVFSKTNTNQDKRSTLWMVVCLNNVVTWVMHLTPEQWLVVLSTWFCTRSYCIFIENFTWNIVFQRVWEAENNVVVSPKPLRYSLTSITCSYWRTAAAARGKLEIFLSVMYIWDYSKKYQLFYNMLNSWQSVYNLHHAKVVLLKPFVSIYCLQQKAKR